MKAFNMTEYLEEYLMKGGGANASSEDEDETGDYVYVRMLRAEGKWKHIRSESPVRLLRKKAEEMVLKGLVEIVE